MLIITNQTRILRFTLRTISKTRFWRILFQGIGFGLTFTLLLTFGSVIYRIGLNNIHFCRCAIIRSWLRNYIIGRSRLLLPRVRWRRLLRSLLYRTNNTINGWSHWRFRSSRSRSIRQDNVQCARLRIHEIKVLGVRNFLLFGYTCPHRNVFGNLIDKGGSEPMS